MSPLIHRTLLAALTTLLAWPGAMPAQPRQDPGQDAQAQSDNQTGAQQGPRRRAGAMQRQRQHMAMLAEKLNLTDAQKKQFQEINQEMRKQGMAVRQDSSLNDEQKKAKMQELRKHSHQQMFGVLTPEQKEKLKQL